MLEIIKSTYFLTRLFFHIDDKIKLELIKYNKNLQKILDISLMNYRIFSGKYIIYDGKGKGKIYDAYNDKLLFEGELLKGKKNGKGKEYDKYGNIKFIGEYLNEKRISKGNEIKDGFGCQYDKYNCKLFEGEFLNGKRNGEGKEYYEFTGKLRFEGEYLNGKRNGKGKEYYFNGNIKYNGEYYYGKKWNGFEYDFNNNIVYELKKGKGYITEYDDNNRLIFDGEYINGY